MSEHDDCPMCNQPRIVRARWTRTDEHGQVHEMGPIPATFLPFGVDPYDFGQLVGIERRR